MNIAFDGYHPAVNFLFFIGAIGFGMFFVHPCFVILSVVLSALYYLLLHRGRGVKYILGMALFALAVALINPLVNTLGDTPLFTYFGRPYTKESLCYGLALGGMFFSVLIWFSCYNQLMTSDKFIYLFGKLIPALSLLLSMVLRLVPMLKRRISMISGVRESIGKSPSRGTVKARASNSADVLSVLMTWSLEGAVTTADSMRSRGYGSGPRTNFLQYHLRLGDTIALILMLIFSAGLIGAMALGVTTVSYTPQIEIPAFDWKTALGVVCYGGLLLIPSVIHIMEELKWHVLRSKI